MEACTTTTTEPTNRRRYVKKPSKTRQHLRLKQEKKQEEKVGSVIGRPKFPPKKKRKCFQIKKKGEKRLKKKRMKK